MVTTFDTEQQRFTARSRALFYARLAFAAIGILSMLAPGFPFVPDLNRVHLLPWNLAVVLYAVIDFIVVERESSYARPLTYATLLLDLAWVILLIVYSGGLGSPVMATQVVFTILFTLLFPRPLAILPPLLTLPIVAWLDRFFPGRAAYPGEIVLLLWYAALDCLAVYVVVYLNRTEARQGLAIDDLERELKQQAINEERLRLAREIHDGLGASLSGLLIQAEYLSHLTREPELLTEIAELREAAQESIDELRRSILMLRSDFDLLPCLEEFCMIFQERSRVWTAFRVRGPERPLSGETQLTIFRILQEALHNVGKHANAHRVDVLLEYAESGLTMVVADDGRGFDPAEGKAHHYGLLNMAERARQQGGEVVVVSERGGGTRITLSLPDRLRLVRTSHTPPRADAGTGR